MLLGYLMLTWAVILGTVLAAALSLGFLGRQQVLTCLLPAVSPLVFLAGAHSALVIALIAIAGLAILWHTVQTSARQTG